MVIGDLKNLLLFLGKKLIPRLPLERGTITEALTPLFLEVGLPSIVRGKRHVQPYQRLLGRQTGRLDRTKDLQLLFRSHPSVPPSHMPRLFLSRCTSSMVSAKAFFRASFSSLTRCISALVASRLVSMVSPFFPASKKAFDH